MTTFNTCRFCGKRVDSDDLVKYGTRHHAHPRCYLTKGKPLDDLPTWALEDFPYFALKEHGKLDEVRAILQERKSNQWRRK